jgi:hypothetical protein
MLMGATLQSTHFCTCDSCEELTYAQLLPACPEVKWSCFVQLLLTAANGDVVECSEESGLTQGIVAAAAEDEDAETAEGSAGDASAAAGSAGHPRPRGQDTDSHGFPVKESFFLSLAALPARVQAATVLVSNLSSGGMVNVRRLCARLVDATAADPTAMRDIAVYIIPNAKGANDNRSVAAVAKVYKETTGVHFPLWSLSPICLCAFELDTDTMRANAQGSLKYLKGLSLSTILIQSCLSYRQDFAEPCAALIQMMGFLLHVCCCSF